MKSEDKIAINSIGVDTRTFAKSLNEFGRQARAVHKVCLKLHIAHLQQTVSDRKAKEKTMPPGPALFRHRRRTNQIERQLKDAQARLDAREREADNE